MGEIIQVADLPASIQTDELVQAWVDGANAKASRVAPCLVAPTSTAWVASTAYVVGDQVQVGTGFLEVTTAGTSGTPAAPVVPTAVGDTVTDGTVTWTRIAPSESQLAEARLVLIGAVKRWAEAGSGALQTQSAGPFSVGMDTRQRTGFNLWPSEIEGLQEICAEGTDSSASAFSITPSGGCSAHMPWCSLAFGATYCSCGADLTNYQYALYEGGVLTGTDGYDTGDYY